MVITNIMAKESFPNKQIWDCYWQFLRPLHSVIMTFLILGLSVSRRRRPMSVSRPAMRRALMSRALLNKLHPRTLAPRSPNSIPIWLELYSLYSEVVPHIRASPAAAELLEKALPKRSHLGLRSGVRLLEFCCHSCSFEASKV